MGQVAVEWSRLRCDGGRRVEDVALLWPDRGQLSQGTGRGGTGDVRRWYRASAGRGGGAEVKGGW